MRLLWPAARALDRVITREQNLSTNLHNSASCNTGQRVSTKTKVRWRCRSPDLCSKAEIHDIKAVSSQQVRTTQQASTPIVSLSRIWTFRNRCWTVSRKRAVATSRQTHQKAYACKCVYAVASTAWHNFVGECLITRMRSSNRVPVSEMGSVRLVLAFRLLWGLQVLQAADG